VRALALLALAALAGRARAQDSTATERPGGILYLEGAHAYALSAPPGWVFDRVAARRQGLPAVMYPEGESWRDAVAVMYPNTIPRRDGEGVEQVIARDVRAFKENAHALRVDVAEPEATSDGKTALVRLFSGGEHGNFEAVGYIEEAHAFTLLVLTSRTEAAFREALPAFRELLRSYHLVGDEVVVEDGPPP
jgi:hypothetical protein